MADHAGSWPIYYKDLLHLGNPQSQVGIITLWTKKEHVIKKLNSQKYAVVGQLYSKEEGINSIVRNCLANKNIRHLIVVGVDLTKNADILFALFEYGVDKEQRIKGINEPEPIVIDPHIPLTAIESFRKHVQIHDCRKIKDYAQLNAFIDALPQQEQYGASEIFPIEKKKTTEGFPTDPVLKIRESFVSDAWLRAIKTVMKFGVTKKSQYGSKQKEVLTLAITITEENPSEGKMHWKNFFPFTQEELLRYIPSVTTAQGSGDVAYTYGQRLRERIVGDVDLGNIDQISLLKKKLEKHPFSRRAIAVTWNVQADSQGDNPPCLVVVQMLVQKQKTHFIAYFRSNDLFAAWPKNVFALRTMQAKLSGELGLEMGSLTTISQSAHIYEHDWKKVQGILKKHKPVHRLTPDPRGNVVITLGEGTIKVNHVSPTGKVLEELEGKTAIELYKYLAVEQKISDISHAMDIGCELQKAQIALEQGLSYEQDRPLVFS